MDGSAPTYDELLDLTRRRARQVDRLRAEVERLEAELEPSRRAGKRQAAPFSKGAPRAHPRPPGRKTGHPPGHRPAPPPEQVDRTIEVPLPETCPGRRAPPDEAPVVAHDPYRIDLPGPEPIVARFRVPVTRCPGCYRRIQGRHPQQTSGAPGAAAVQYGPRLLGFAADLRHRLGASYRERSSIRSTLTGSVVASAALVRSGHRPRHSARPGYDRLAEAARRGAVRHVDEAGWEIGGRSAWLWVLADGHATLHRIGTGRGHEAVVEVLGGGYQGVLAGDCFLAYDPPDFTEGRCSAHLLERCSEVERSKSRGAVRSGRRVAALLRRAMTPKRRGRPSDRGYAVLRGKVHAELDRLLAGAYTDPDNARPAKLLREHRDSVPRFPDRDGVDAPNDLAEREGRPAVIARELSAGSRTEEGAETHAVPASAFRTSRRQGRDILAAAAELFRRGPGHVLEFDHIPPGVAAQ